MAAFDLDAYLRRIGHAGARDASLGTLAAVHAAHAAAIAFENLDPWLGVPVALDDVALQAKLVRRRRGGYCYEHNGLLASALRALGFDVRPLAARVRWNVPDGIQRPRTHMLLAVTVAEGRHVVDAGFGRLTLTGPLRLDRRMPQATPHGRFRLRRAAEGYELEADVGGDWRPLYGFDLQRQEPGDYALASWYLCHHPESVFRSTLMAARVAPDGRHALLDDRLSFHPLDGPSRSRVLADRAEVRSALEGVFGLDLDGLPGLDARIERMLRRA